MPVLGITGGIATGKTRFTSALRRLRPDAAWFDADARARELVRCDPAVRERIRAEFGDAVFSPAGEVDRASLREIVFQREEKRRALEAILHPVIREAWVALAVAARAEKRWLFVDIPLLFETSTETFFGAVAVVACAAATQMRRLTAVRKLTPDMAAKIIHAQMPLREKIERADHVIWNDGGESALEAQTLLFSEYLSARHG